MKITFIRHGDACPVSKTYTEENRPLTEKGNSETKKVGEYLSNKKNKFDAVWISPYVRAIESKDNIIKNIEYKSLDISESLMPFEDPEVIIKKINSSYKTTHNILIIGHQPQIGKILSIMFETDETIFEVLPATSIEIEVKRTSHGDFKYVIKRFLQVDDID
jgi:phosphohistidine phosphatase